jgi:serine/threonine protein kinase
MKIQPLDPNSLFLVPYPTNFTNFLLSKRKILSLNTKILLLLKIDKALSYFHGKGFQHLDLKPDNILLDSK